MDYVLGVVADMPVEDQKKVAEKIIANLPKETESDLLKKGIDDGMKSLREDWADFPGSWEPKEFDGLCRKMRKVWNLIDSMERAIKTEELAKKAQAILDAGFSFNRIEIGGETFHSDGKMIADAHEAPPNLPDDNIPF